MNDERLIKQLVEEAAAVREKKQEVERTLYDEVMESLKKVAKEIERDNWICLLTGRSYLLTISVCVRCITPREMDFVPFSERPEWQDVTPIPQNDGPHPVVSIAYSDEFRETMDYFRAIVAANEMSRRALELTREVIAQNPASYMAFQYRRRVLLSLGCDLERELDFVDLFAEDNPKNYQLWYHRRALVERIGARGAHRELEFTAALLEQDDKNYHAWCHRQWVIRTYGLWDREMDFCHTMLAKDLHNNSAWNQRFFVLQNRTALSPAPPLASASVETTTAIPSSSPSPACPPADTSCTDTCCNPQHRGPGGLCPFQVTARELPYAMGFIRRDPGNESPWTYLRGVLRGAGLPLDTPQVLAFCQEVLASAPECRFALALLLDGILEGLPGGSAAVPQGGGTEERNDHGPVGGVSSGPEAAKQPRDVQGALAAALGMAQRLAQTDVMRVRYWEYMAGVVRELQRARSS
eukprot:jgi/Mesvir1/25384/Mv01424-RA.1